MIRDTIETVVKRYPPQLWSWLREDIDRQAFQVALATEGMQPGARIADVGSGIGLFPPSVAALGFHAIAVDDFSDLGDAIVHDVPSIVHGPLGVEVIKRDVVTEGVCFMAGSLDVVTTFATMEHFHHSPKRLFHDCMRALRPGGRFVIGVPNAENLRKRVSAPFGITWSHMTDWYEREVFRGHVREPNLGDLKYIARDLGLVDVKVYGRNWIGYISPRPMVRRVTPVIDRVLQMRPSLCSDLYLVGRKAR